MRRCHASSDRVDEPKRRRAHLRPRASSTIARRDRGRLHAPAERVRLIAWRQLSSRGAAAAIPQPRRACAGTSASASAHGAQAAHADAPIRDDDAFDLDAALRARDRGRGLRPAPEGPLPPLIRVHGQLEPIAGAEPLTPEDTERVFAPDAHRPGQARRVRSAEHEVDFAYARRRAWRASASTPSASAARSRSSAARSRIEIKTIEELLLPPVITELAEEERGIILVTGTTGSGKSTTLAAMIDHINRDDAEAHRHDRGPDRVPAPRQAARSSTSARSGRTPRSFKRALRRVLRQDPDVILIGEMRDEETVRTALSRRRDRPPRALDAPHGRRRRDGQPHHRLLPAPPCSSRCARCSPARSRASSPSASCRTPTATAAWPSARSCG